VTAGQGWRSVPQASKTKEWGWDNFPGLILSGRKTRQKKKGRYSLPAKLEKGSWTGSLDLPTDHRTENLFRFPARQSDARGIYLGPGGGGRGLIGRAFERRPVFPKIYVGKTRKKKKKR